MCEVFHVIAWLIKQCPGNRSTEAQVAVRFCSVFNFLKNMPAVSRAI
jgi:hypothetical protein